MSERSNRSEKDVHMDGKINFNNFKDVKEFSDSLT